MSIQRDLEGFAIMWAARRNSSQRMLEKPYEQWTDLELRKGAELFEDTEARHEHQKRRHAALRTADRSGFFQAMDERARQDNRKFTFEEVDCELDRYRHVTRQKK